MNKYKVRQIFPEAIKSELIAVDFDKHYLAMAEDKYRFNLIKVSCLKSPAANILKQAALSKGGDFAVSTGVVNCQKEFTDGILAVTDRQLKRIIESLKMQPFGLKTLAAELEIFLNNKYPSLKSLKIRNKSFFWGTKTYTMGILNITPDSFSDGGDFLSVENALSMAAEMLNNDVDIIDLGGESTRPYSVEVDTETQLQRLLPVLTEIKKQFPEVILSIDTRNHIVAEEALNKGADIINDVSGLSFDPEMVKVVSANKVPVIIMHTLSTPDVMQVTPEYENVMDEICHSLLSSVEKAIENGIAANNIIIDPGIGFGKTINHNLEVIQRISEIKSLGYPVLVGPSRKSFIGKLLNEEIRNREEGTAATNAYLITQGVDMLRIHDIKYHSKVIKMLDNIVRSRF